ncbi:hypothetical protein MKW92_023610 [Papaver armeniacum]|nr:hypothetical protein MKW92_023610 [Papaver armeniacum]
MAKHPASIQIVAYGTLSFSFATHCSGMPSFLLSNLIVKLMCIKVSSITLENPYEDAQRISSRKPSG